MRHSFVHFGGGIATDRSIYGVDIFSPAQTCIDGNQIIAFCMCKTIGYIGGQNVIGNTFPASDSLVVEGNRKKNRIHWIHAGNMEYIFMLTQVESGVNADMHILLWRINHTEYTGRDGGDRQRARPDGVNHRSGHLPQVHIKQMCLICLIFVASLSRQV